MKSILLCAAAATALLATGAGAQSLTTTAVVAAPSATSLDAPRMGTWGYDLSGREVGVTAGDNFYKFSNGAWDARTEIPADRSRFGAFDNLRELSDARSRAVIETAAAKVTTTGEAQQVGGLYASFMNEAKIEALDAKPLAAPLAAIKAAKKKASLVAAAVDFGKKGNKSLICHFA